MEILDYKREIIEMVEGIADKDTLEYIYILVADVVKEDINNER